MRETFFGPLINEVEQKIIKQQGDKWERELFEKHLMGYTIRTDRHRLVSWRDHRNVEADPVFESCTITRTIRKNRKMWPKFIQKSWKNWNCS